MASHKRCMKSDRRWQTRWFRTDVRHTALLFICGICMHYRRPASTTTTMQKNKIEWNWNRGRTKESKQQQRNLVWNIINNKKKKKKTTSVVTTNTQKLCNRKSRVNKMWQPFLVRRAKSTNIRLPERSSNNNNIEVNILSKDAMHLRSEKRIRSVSNSGIRPYHKWYVRMDTYKRNALWREYPFIYGISPARRLINRNEAHNRLDCQWILVFTGCCWNQIHNKQTKTRKNRDGPHPSWQSTDDSRQPTWNGRNNATTKKC